MMRALAALLAAGLVLAAPVTPAAASGEGRPVATIRYTAYGIPHITASTFTGLGQGYGYAAARDNLCVLADAYLTLRAERSRFLGAAAPVTTGFGPAADSLTSDLYFAQVNAGGVVERLSGRRPPAGPEPEVAQLVRGYAAGYNRYLADVGGPRGIADPACRGASWVRPITALDVYRHVYALATLAGTGGVVDGIVAAQPSPVATRRTATRQDPAPGDTAARLVAGIRAERGDADLGSNAIAAGSAGTAHGGAVLLGNPHYPWHGIRRFWQSRLTVPGRLDVAGASLLGLPSVAIGYTAAVAWSHTVSTAATFGLYENPVVPGDPTSYLIDGVPERMTSRDVSIEVRDPGRPPRIVRHTFFATRYGPVVATGPGGVALPWGTTVYSVRDPNAGNLRMLNTWLGLARARSTSGVRSTLAGTQGLAWVNTVAADRGGRTLYADIQPVPGVTDDLAARCSTPLGARVYPASGISVLDGGRSACAWTTGPDAMEAGTLGPALLPALRRRDFVTNSNDSPWLTNPAVPLIGYPRGVGDTGTARTPRTRQGIIAVRERIAGTDGRPGRGFTLRSLRETLIDGHSRTADLILRDTVAMCRAFPEAEAPTGSGTVEVRTGCAALAAWDADYDLDGRGSLLFARFVARLGTLGAAAWAVPFDPADPVGTPRGLAAADPRVQQAFGAAAAELTGGLLTQDAALRDHQYVTRGGQRIPLPGGAGNLGVLNVLSGVWASGAGYTDVTHGSSYVQVVEFEPGRAVRAETLLTYSQSSDPTSAHYADQTRLFSAGRWVPGGLDPAPTSSTEVLVASRQE